MSFRENTVKIVATLGPSSNSKEMLKKLHAQAKKDVADSIYRSVPGIGALSARILATELGDMSQFSNVKGLYSFMGLTPSEYSSGEHKRLGHITHQGRPILRKIWSDD